MRKKVISPRHRFAVQLVATVLLASGVSASTFTVSNVKDEGAGSLRKAILDANAHPNSPANTPDQIRFAIPGNGPHFIGLVTGLPKITDPVAIDGYSQGKTTLTKSDDAKPNTNPVGQGLNSDLRIVLESAGVQAGELRIEAGGSTLRGLVIHNLFEGILMLKKGGNVVEGCYIGTDVTGTQAVGNELEGISINEVSDNTIGGTTPQARNLISGNGGNGISLNFSGEIANNKIQGNLIGVDKSGTKALGNQGTGVYISSGKANIIGGPEPGAGNVISGNEADGIDIYNSGAETTVAGNFIGTNAAGTAAIGNGSIGVLTFGSSNLIGGDTPGAGNVISGNLFGVAIEGLSNTVAGNFIGTNSAGTAAVPNQDIGLILGGNQTMIGGTTAGARNVISGNKADGIATRADEGGTGSQNFIKGNYIGVAKNGAVKLPNIGNGVSVTGASENVIGGEETGASNVISGNTGHGVRLTGTTAQGNRVQANSIYGNTKLGIDLGNEGVTPNDKGDADSGPNGLQNYPVIDAAHNSNGRLTLFGGLNSAASMDYTLEFFADSAADASNFGEGKNFLGSARLTSSGDACFNVTLPLPQGVTVVSATATDPKGNSSEFSASHPIATSSPGPSPCPPTPVTLPGGAAQLLNISTRLRVLTDEKVLIGGFIITGSEPKKVIIRVLGPSLSGVGATLQDPTVELHRGNTTLESNDDWKTRTDGSSQEAVIKATGIPPSIDAEAAIVRTLEPGFYTAIVRGKNNSTGVGLIELYDLAQDAQSKLANISSRGFVDSGDAALIGGFIAGNGTEIKVVVRALGPSLEGQNISGFLPDPTLKLVDANGATVRQNDNWKLGQKAELEALNIQPSRDAESALIATLPAGSYTAVVQGKNNAKGVAVVEVYNVP